MIGGVRAYEAAVPCDNASHLNGDFVRFGTTAAEDHAFDAVVMKPGEPFRESYYTFMKISAVNVDSGLLLRHRLYNCWIGVSDAWHIVVHIDIAPAVPII